MCAYMNIIHLFDMCVSLYVRVCTFHFKYDLVLD